jgi:hypothetical protein
MVFITIVITGANLNQLISWGPHIVGKQDFAKKMIDRKSFLVIDVGIVNGNIYSENHQLGESF